MRSSRVVPHVTYDRTVDAAYVTLRRGRVARSDALDEGRVVDYDKSGQALGVEFLGVHDGVDLQDLPDAELLEKLLVRRFRKLRIYAA
jgi:uncharacterized protein YuzE